jgi:myo-inositol-1(or 4)-monophosphatase
MTNLASDLDLIRDAALAAGKLALEHREAGLKVWSKAGGSPVTSADLAVDQLLRDTLLTARPDYGWLSEETADNADRLSKKRIFVVDPIDGTVAYMKNKPWWCVPIAVVEDGRPVAAVIHAPMLGEMFEATLGGGAFCDGRPLAVRETPPMAERLVMTGFNYVTAVRRGQALAAGRLLPAVRDIRRSGSAALDLCALGAGRADAYVEEGLHLWDRAAGGLVATEAGAVVEVHPGAGGMDCVVAAPASGFADFSALVRDCGFLAE